MLHRFGVLLSEVLAAALLLSGCTTTVPQSSSGPVSVGPAVASPSPSGSVVPGFAVPITLEAPADMPLEVHDPHLLTWRVTTNDDDKIRIMVPISVQPDGASPKPPADHHDSVTGLVQKGAVITGDTATTIGGLPAHRFTITSTRAIDSGTGCWSDADDGCFGLPPDLTLHMATVTVSGHAVVLWARTLTAHPNVTMIAAFERMLPTIRFD